MLATLDPLRLLDEIRVVQEHLAGLAKGEVLHVLPHRNADLERFLRGLATAWKHGEVRPTHRAGPKPPRHWRARKDPLEAVWPRAIRARSDRCAHAAPAGRARVCPQPAATEHRWSPDRRVRSPEALSRKRHDVEVERSALPAALRERAVPRFVGSGPVLVMPPGPRTVLQIDTSGYQLAIRERRLARTSRVDPWCPGGTRTARAASSSTNPERPSSKRWRCVIAAQVLERLMLP